MNIFEATFVEPVAATGLFSQAWLLIAIPLFSAAILLLLGRVSDSWGHILGCLAPLASFVIGCVLFAEMFGRSQAEQAVSIPVYKWIAVGGWIFNFKLLIDPLSILFVLLITGVGLLIHIYSISYMAHDERRRRFFAYLNFFIGAMLLLVLADNYLLMFVGWEGVGLASYLLIGFWQHKPSAAYAAKKAFVVNRVGDLGMLLAIFSMLAMFGSSSFIDVNRQASELTPLWATLIGFFLLLAACGKSAQVPLQSWLLDAMEGPTPVSALIHAATMVTAGVYLVVRSHVLFDQTPTASLAVAIVGTVTLLAGAWIGCAKADIKKVLAGSTMSQIGYMMLAAGLGPVGAAFAIFHLITHGFFKANMFLGAGSIMHAMDDDVDMHHYGALARFMPITFITFACGYLAIIGFPFTAGFYSKDHIIEAAFDKSLAFGLLAIFGAGLTGFYMTRLIMMTFAGLKRWRTGIHPHESPILITVPLIILAILSLIAGLVMNGWIQSWLSPVTGHHIHETSLLAFSPIGLATLAVVALGIFIGWWLFRGEVADTQPTTHNPVVLIGRNDLYGDAINKAIFIDPTMALSSGLDLTDRKGFDGIVEGSAVLVARASQWLRKVQNGYVRSYALTMVLGIIGVGVVLILGQLG